VVLSAQLGEVLGGRHGASSLIIGDFASTRAAPGPPAGAPVGGSAVSCNAGRRAAGRSRTGGGTGAPDAALFVPANQSRNNADAPLENRAQFAYHARGNAVYLFDGEAAMTGD
jgi:hypothetical protein